MVKIFKVIFIEIWTNNQTLFFKLKNFREILDKKVHRKQKFFVKIHSEFFFNTIYTQNFRLT